eukprot:TRINITY_DN5104_c0_g1_i1.p2 TRINITY_DN5104_c0_g1~~TRINITY_DN5104_c0_g1_i1.p2  ORF type:complete len:101 (-),score=17.73 TRINITY_DN5104_c0_g1_i1:155-457(-)
MKIELFFEDYKDAPFIHRESRNLRPPSDDEDFDEFGSFSDPGIRDRRRTRSRYKKTKRNEGQGSFRSLRAGSCTGCMEQSRPRTNSYKLAMEVKMSRTPS